MSRRSHFGGSGLFVSAPAATVSATVYGEARMLISIVRQLGDSKPRCEAG
jgi:hypothetical protein